MPVEITRRENGSVAIRGLRFDRNFRLSDTEIIKKMPIRYLTIRDSDLRYWPIGMFNLNEIKGIRLDSVDFERIPDEFLRIRTLRFFSILRSPDFASASPNLRYNNLLSLTISRCGLNKIPDFVYGMTSLTHLRLPYNNITSVPGFVGALTRLRDLDLRNNHLSDLPEILARVGVLRSQTIAAGAKSLRGLRLSGNPLNEPFASALLRGPEALFQAIEGDITDAGHVPPQGLAPLSAKIEGNVLVRQREPLTEKSATRADRLNNLSSLLLQESNSLKQRIGNHSPGLERALNNYVITLSGYPENFDPIVLGYWGNIISKLSLKLTEEVFAEEDGLFDAFRLNHFLFVGQFDEWAEFVNNANKSLLTAESIAASRISAEAFINDLKSHGESVDSEIVNVLNNLKISVYETAEFDKESAYGLYKSIENVAVVLADALVRLGPSEAKKFAWDVAKAVRENAVGAVAGGATAVFITSAKHMAALSETIPAMFSWIPSLLRYLGV